MKKSIIIAILITLLGSFVKGQSNLTPYLDSAQTAYANNDFKNSVRLYLRVVEHGYESPQIFYNIGNGYYKQMRIANAILWYQKALQIDPTYEDAIANLKLAQELIVDKIDPIAPPFYKRWYKNMMLWFSPNTWAVITLASFSLFTIALFILFSNIENKLRGLSIPVGILAFILSVGSFFISKSAFDYVTNRTLGVVMSPSVTIRSTPYEEGTKLFTIHEGLTVNITTKVEGWYEIRLEDGRVGWLMTKDVEAI